MAPALSRLREETSEKVILVGYPERLAPLVEAGLADRAVSIDRWLSEGISCSNERLERESGRIGEAQGSVEPSRIRVDSFFPTLPVEIEDSAAHIGVHPPQPTEGSGVHAALHLARALGVKTPNARTNPLSSLLADRTCGGRARLWIHPGAGGPDKRWPLASFLEVARLWAKRSDSEVRFVLGEADLDLRAAIRSAGFDLERPPTLLDLARGFTRGDCFLGNDSGPAHLAALMGLGTIALFVTTDPILWSPWGSQSRAVSAGVGACCLEPVDILPLLEESLTIRND